MSSSPSSPSSPPAEGWSRSGAQEGSVLPLVALLVLAVGGLCVGLSRLGGDAMAAAQARTAADAAALAGAAEGEGAARDLAAANGAELVHFVQEGAEVQVRARVRGAEAVARAERAGPGWCRPPGSDPVHFGRCPESRAGR